MPAGRETLKVWSAWWQDLSFHSQSCSQTWPCASSSPRLSSDLRAREFNAPFPVARGLHWTIYFLFIVLWLRESPGLMMQWWPRTGCLFFNLPVTSWQWRPRSDLLMTESNKKGRWITATILLKRRAQLNCDPVLSHMTCGTLFDPGVKSPEGRLDRAQSAQCISIKFQTVCLSFSQITCICSPNSCLDKRQKWPN